MLFLPIKNDDPKLDFYTMYRRETMEYDTEYMQKYNEDLNTTLIFERSCVPPIVAWHSSHYWAGLFSAVSSAFIIDAQPNLQQDPGDRSEAYLRAILLSLNQSIVPDEMPPAPPAWNGPPAEVVTTVTLLYASLLVSLLAAFVGMLGKQWVNRYLRHTGGSMVERCGDRQRKFDGLEKWPFRLFIKFLHHAPDRPSYLRPVTIRVVGQYVHRHVISSIVLGIVFYVGIVIARTYSYERPFQTPALVVLWHLRDNGTTQR